jgi:diaminohydroxyphosphoribosylaminopyrimidine deaminase/5-amino-6-(5-phosphoribosylamino)uracil reductase
LREAARAKAGAAPAAPPAGDERFTRLALSVGRRQLGRTWPNPSVGAVLVDEGRGIVLAQGATGDGGRPHAERIALDEAGSAARGATLYVTLEPCSHHGRTPPCADAIVAAGVARVVGALDDPDPRVAGLGYARLRAAGVAVTVGVGAREAARDHRGHVLRVMAGRPAVTLKLARTADGFAARSEGPRLLITGERANARVHLMRTHADAVLVGVETVIADDPLLTVRLPGLEDRLPVRIVLDSGLRTPVASRLVAGAAAHPLWIVAAESAAPDDEARLREGGAEVIRVPVGPDGRVDLRRALRALADRGLTRLFCEGGPRLAEALASADLLDEVVVVAGAAPLGEPGLPAIGPVLSDALQRRFRPCGTETAGPDRLASYERI